MEKHRYQAKTIEEAIENAKIDLQETEDNLIIKQLEDIKGGRSVRLSTQLRLKSGFI